MQNFNARLTEKRLLTPTVVELVMELDQNELTQFEPGQFVQFLISEKTFRSYSIVSLPQDLPRIVFCIKLEDNGVGSRYVEKLEVGDVVPMRGPLGKFVVRDAHEPMVFMANGVGVAPFFCMAHDVLSKNSEAGITLAFGVRTKEDLFYHQTFAELAETHPNFTFIPTVSRADATWVGYSGRVTQYITEHYPQHKPATFYLCGSLSMVQDVRLLLMQNGHTIDKIKLEIFT